MPDEKRSSAQEDHFRLSELAERLFKDDDNDENKGSFINDGMKRLGYKPRIEWEEPEAEKSSGKAGGDFFGSQYSKRN